MGWSLSSGVAQRHGCNPRAPGGERVHPEIEAEVGRSRLDTPFRKDGWPQVTRSDPRAGRAIQLPVIGQWFAGMAGEPCGEPTWRSLPLTSGSRGSRQVLFGLSVFLRGRRWRSADILTFEGGTSDHALAWSLAGYLPVRAPSRRCRTPVRVLKRKFALPACELGIRQKRG